MTECRDKGYKSAPVVNSSSDRIPIGFVALDRLHYLLSTRFGFALYQNKKVQSIMETMFLMVDKDSDLSDVVTGAMNRTPETLYDDIIVTDQGVYSGIISVKQLMVAQMEKIFSQSRHIDHQHQHLKVARHQIEHGEIRYKKLFEKSCSGLAVIDPDGLMVKINRRMAELLRVSEHQIENNVFFQSLVHPNDLSRLSVIFIDLERYYSTGSYKNHSPETFHEIKIKTQQDEWLTVEMLCQYLASPRQFLISVIDITEKKMMEEKILQTEKMSAIGTLVAGISHELNNQITPILGYCDLMLNQTHDVPEIRKSVFKRSAGQRPRRPIS